MDKKVDRRWTGQGQGLGGGKEMHPSKVVGSVAATLVGLVMLMLL